MACVRYQLLLTFYQKTGGLVQQSIAVDDIGTGATVELNGMQPTARRNAPARRTRPRLRSWPTACAGR